MALYSRHYPTGIKEEFKTIPIIIKYVYKYFCFHSKQPIISQDTLRRVNLK